ncbi:MAG: ABC transporter substrate-binding protein [Beijerinckiaceae bacterium]
MLVAKPRMMESRNALKAVLAMAGVVLAGTLHGGAASAQELRIGLSSEPSSMDPHYHNLTPNNSLSRHVFEPLVGQDAKQALVPGLAESWKAINETTWEFKLRKGVKFFDATPFTADDVIATAKRIPNVPRSPSSFASFIGGVTFEKVDDHTILAKTAAPAPLVPTNLSTFGIVSKLCAESMSTEDFNALKCQGGTGPFKYTEFKPGDRVVMERNEAYHGKKADWAKVSYRFLTSAPTRVASLLAGDVDVIDAVPPTDMARLKSTANINVVQELSNRVIYFHLDQFRQTSPFITAKDGSAIKNPLMDKRVREALSKAINRPAIVERIMEGQAVPAEQVLPNIFFGTSKTLKPTEFDLAGARKLLADAGFPNGFKMKMHGPNGRYVNDTKIIEAVAQMFTRAGIEVEIETIPPANFFTRASTGGKNDAGETGFPEFSFILVGWGAGTGETLGSLSALLGTVNRATGAGAANRGRYSNKLFDEKLAEAAKAVDDAKRQALLAEVSEIGMKDFGIIPTHYQVNVWASRKGFKVIPRADEYSLAMGMNRE